MRVDLDATRAARAEVGAEPHVITFGGEDFDLVREMPLQFMDELQKGATWSAAKLLFVVPEDADRFLAHGPTVPDLESLASVYGAGDLGESPASGKSSKNTSNGSRLISSGTTT